MKTAACYIRVSTDDQLEYSPDAQLREIRKYAASHDLFLDPAHIYMDEGISGRTAAKRPAFNKMIGVAKLKPRPFDTILLWKFSRFARNREDAVVYKSMLRKLGIEVVSISENIGDDKMSVLIEAMIEAMDEYYSINLGEEVIRGMTQKALTGGVNSIPSFGYDMLPGNKHFTINKEEAEYVRLVFDMYISGSSLFAIARHLNSLGVRTKKGNKFENRQIEYMLNNPVYKGYVRWTPTKTVSKRIYDSPDTIITKGEHEPIIPEEKWEEAHNLYLKRKAMREPYQKPSETRKHFLSGILRCGCCGSTLVYAATGNGFQCHAYSHGKCDHSCYVSAEKIKRIILDELTELEKKHNSVFVHIPVTTQNNDITNTQKEIANLKKILQKAQDAYLAGIDTLEEYGKNKKRLQGQIATLQSKLENIDAATIPSVRPILISEIKDMILSDNDYNEKNRSLSSVFESITFQHYPTDTLKFYLR